jgi:hypothetical protein
MKRTLSRTQRARCPPGARRGGGLSACRGGGPRACPTAVHRRRVKRARYSGGAELYAEAAALGIPEFGHTGPPGPPGGRADQGSSCPGAQTPRTRTALSCRRSTTCPGWKSQRPGERRTTASAPAEAVTPRPDESPGRPAGPPSGRSPAGYGPAASGTYAPTHFATGISASCERPPPGPGSPEATRILRSGCHSVVIDPGVPQEPVEPIPGTAPLNPQPGGVTGPGPPRPRPPSPGRGSSAGSGERGLTNSSTWGIVPWGPWVSPPWGMRFQLHSMAMLCIAMHGMAVPVGGQPPCVSRSRPAPEPAGNDRAG